MRVGASLVGICQLVNVLGLEAFNLRAVLFLCSQRHVRVMLWQQHAWGSATLPWSLDRKSGEADETGEAVVMLRAAVCLVLITTLFHLLSPVTEKSYAFPLAEQLSDL